MELSKSQFKAKALEFFRLVESTQQSIIVTDHGKPTVEIRPYAATAKDPLSVLHGSVLHYAAPLDPVGEADWDAMQ